jgi:ElaB/YqjD/DUF883 family membrane-anchored ribosome-binding protein
MAHLSQKWDIRVEWQKGDGMTEQFQTTPANGGGTTDQAKEKAQEAAGQAKEKAQEAAGQAKNRLTTEVDTRSTQAGEQLRSTADDVRSVAVELRGQGKDKPAELAEKAAERVQEVGDYLHRSDGDRLLRDAEDFARRKPWAVAAGGLALGFAASRFLKASSSRRYAASRSDYRTPGDGAARWPAEASRVQSNGPPAVPPEPVRPGVS